MPTLRLRSITAFAALLALSGAAPSHARAAQREAWYKILFSGAVVGVGRDLWAEDDSSRYFETHLEFRASRAGTQVEIISHLEERDDYSGRPLRFRSEVTVTGTTMAVSGESRGDSVYVRSEGRGYGRDQVIAWEAGALGQASVDERVRRELRTGRRDFSLRVFDSQSAKYRTSRFRTGERLRHPVAGDTVELLVVEQFVDDGATPAMTLFVDDEGDVQRMWMRLMGAEIVIERVTSEEFGHLELDPNFDMIRGSLIPCRGYDVPPEQLDAVTFRMTLSQPPGDVNSLQGPNQTVVRADGRVVDLEVTRDTIHEQLATDAELQRYLKADRYIQSDHPAIKALADSIAGSGERDDPALATEIARWVNRYIEHKDFSQGFATALDVLAAREGDCTEHSVLLAAVLRAAGIPARIAVGVAYYQGSLIGHMWTEVYERKWRTLDALDVGANPIRIRVAVSPDERALNEMDVINAYSLLAGIEVEVTDHRLRSDR
ncbi:MAG: transglutaminase family protein [Candidatus Krumholzibacteriia bacterium]